MKANYHTHTSRCGHAAGTDRDYIEAALAAGLETLGFSDHAPYDYLGGVCHPGIRMAPEELDDYCTALDALRAEYAGRIDVRIGFEAEYYPTLFPRFLDRVRERGVEYLILGQHFLGDEIGQPYSGRLTDDAGLLDRYVGQCIDGMQTGCFSCLAHPDLIRYVGDDALYARQMRRLCRAARDCGLPLEINLHGLAEGRYYPTEAFWRIAGEAGNAVVLGVDAHRPDELTDPAPEAAARALADRCGIRLTDGLALRPL